MERDLEFWQNKVANRNWDARREANSEGVRAHMAMNDVLVEHGHQFQRNQNVAGHKCVEYGLMPEGVRKEFMDPIRGGNNHAKHSPGVTAEAAAAAKRH